MDYLKCKGEGSCGAIILASEFRIDITKIGNKRDGHRNLCLPCETKRRKENKKRPKPQRRNSRGQNKSNRNDSEALTANGIDVFRICDKPDCEYRIPQLKTEYFEIRTKGHSLTCRKCEAKEAAKNARVQENEQDSQEKIAMLEARIAKLEGEKWNGLTLTNARQG